MATSLTAYFLGGTIGMAAGSSTTGATPSLGAADLLATIGPGFEVQAIDFRKVSSARLTFADLVELVRTATAAVEAGSAGVVVVQGTDVLEESAFLLDLLWDRPEPIVVTGAMRIPAAPGADGPANLAAALVVAAEPECRDQGALVVLDDEIHAARSVVKRHTSSTGAFESVNGGVLGRILEGRATMHRRVQRRTPQALPEKVDARVSIATATFDDDPAGYQALAGVSAGLVVAGLGAGHVNPEVAEVLADAAQRIPVVLVSRTGAGSVHRHTYGGAGSEEDLLAKGLVHGGYLDAAKARLLLTVLIGLDCDPAGVAEAFHEYGRG